MIFNPDDIDEMVEAEISKAIAKFAFKYGGDNKFQKQKFLYDLFNQKVPNNGYAKMKVSAIFDEISVELPNEIFNGDVDYEEEYLTSWMTELPALLILSAEPVIQETMPCWFVVYQMQSAGCFFSVVTKYWEHRHPQSSFFRTVLHWKDLGHLCKSPMAEISTQLENSSAFF